MTHPNDLVTIEKCADLTGLSQNAIRAYKKKGQIRQNIHWFEAPNGRIFISLKAFNAWIMGKKA